MIFSCLQPLPTAQLLYTRKTGFSKQSHKGGAAPSWSSILPFSVKGVHYISVIKSKRNESNLQFVDTAFKLYTFTIQQCVKFPKRYTFYVSQEISNTATKILVEVKRGNSIYPTNEHEVQMRRDCFLNAYADAQSLISQINAATELFQISGTVLTGWMELIQSELNLLRGIMKKDKARYKNICQPKTEEQIEEAEITK